MMLMAKVHIKAPNFRKFHSLVFIPYHSLVGSWNRLNFFHSAQKVEHVLYDNIFIVEVVISSTYMNKYEI